MAGMPPLAAGLKAQRQRVRAAVLVAAEDRRSVARARHDAAERLRRVLGQPMGLAACFLTGFIIGSRTGRAETRRLTIGSLATAIFWIDRIVSGPAAAIFVKRAPQSREPNLEE